MNTPNLPGSSPAAPQTSPQTHPVVRLLDHVPLALAMFDTDRRFVFTNEKYLIAFDLDGDAIRGRTYEEVFPRLHPSWRRMFDEALAGRPQRIEEDFFRSADGTENWVRWDLRPWQGTNQAIGGVILSQEIITEQKQKELSLRADRSISRSLRESASVPVLLLNADGLIQHLNEGARRLPGFSALKLGQTPFASLYAKEAESKTAQAACTQAIADWRAAKEITFDAPALMVATSEPQRVVWAATPWRGDNGEGEGLMLTGHLRPAQETVAAAPVAVAPVPVAAPTPPAPEIQWMKNLTAPVIVLSADGRCLSANATAQKQFPTLTAPKADFEALLPSCLSPQTPAPLALKEWKESVKARKLDRSFHLRHGDGIDHHWLISPATGPDDTLILSLTNITVQREAEDKSRALETTLRSLTSAMPQGLILTEEASGMIVEVNPAIESLLGQNRFELRKKPLSAVLSTTDPQATSGTLQLADQQSKKISLRSFEIKENPGQTAQRGFFISEVAAPAPVPSGPISSVGLLAPQWAALTQDPVTSLSAKLGERLMHWHEKQGLHQNLNQAWQSIRQTLSTTEFLAQVQRTQGHSIDFGTLVNEFSKHLASSDQAAAPLKWTGEKVKMPAELSLPLILLVGDYAQAVKEAGSSSDLTLDLAVDSPQGVLILEASGASLNAAKISESMGFARTLLNDFQGHLSLLSGGGRGVVTFPIEAPTA
jgi:PAS domain S-box-containing protein